MFAVINFLAGVGGLVGVYTLEYFFDFSPCDLCVKQRILAGMLIACSLIALFGYIRFNKKVIMVGNVLATVVITAMFGLAIFQVGVERGIFELPETCLNKILEGNNIEDLRKSLMSTDTLKPTCDVPQVLFGLSVAIWSLLGTFGLLGFALFYWVLFFKKSALDNIKR